MARIIFVFLCIGFLGFVSGCNRQNQISSPPQAKPNKIIKQSSFPPFLVGTWESDESMKSLWEFTFEADGKISSMQNFLGILINVSEGQAYKQVTKDNVKVDEACVLGPVEVNYNQNTRQLSVKVVTDYYLLHIFDQTIEGKSIDTITGSISQDGLTWNAEWQSVSGMVNGPPPDFNNPSIVPVQFNKVK